MEKYYFAVDLGATSGRTILGTLVDGRLEQEELTRFPRTDGSRYALRIALHAGIVSVFPDGPVAHVAESVPAPRPCLR